MSGTRRCRGGRRKRTRRFRDRFAASFGEPANHHIKDRRQEDAEESDPEHAAKDSSAKRLTHFSAGPGRNHQRYHAEDESKRSHQNWTQTQTAGIDGRFAPAQAFILALPGELNDEDRILASETNQHDKSNL